MDVRNVEFLFYELNIFISAFYIFIWFFYLVLVK